MSLVEAKDFLLWSFGINYGILLAWFFVFVCAHDWVYRLHTRWFRLPWKASMPSTMSVWPPTRSASFLLNLVPCVALYLLA